MPVSRSTLGADAGGTLEHGSRMRTFRRLYQPGGTYFFTVVTANRWPCFDNADNVRLLGDALRCTRSSHPFDSLAIVVMPDHLHCLWKLMPDDADFSLRWQLVKK